MFPILYIGPFVVQAPGFFILVGLWMGIYLSGRNALRFNVDKKLLYNLVFTSILVSIIGARLVYVARFPQIFASSPLGIVSLNSTMMDLQGGFLAGILVAFIYGQRKNLPLWGTLDALVPGLSFFAAAIGLAHMASGDAYGSPTDLAWGIDLWGESRHPTQILEFVTALVLFIIVYPGSRLVSWIQDLHDHPSVLFLIFIALSAASRIFLEAFRGDSAVIFGRLRIAQLAAWIILAFSLWLLQKRVTVPR